MICLTAILQGILHKSHGLSVGKDPFTPEMLKRIFVVVDFTSHEEKLTWIALLLMFRTLLRISHIIISPHTLHRSDVCFKSWGVVILIKSAKNRKRGSRKVEIPLVNSNCETLCPISWLRHLYRFHPRTESAFLFSTSLCQRFTYSKFCKTFKSLCKKADISGNFSSHSLRKGGATFMANIGLPITDIKDRGLWSSVVVFDYIKPSLDHRCKVDKIFSSCFS